MVDLLDWTPRKDGKPRVLRKPRKAPPALEFPVACMVADTLRRFANAHWVWSHFPAGEQRTAATGARLQRMGLKKGWSDYLLISPIGRLHCLEMKRRGERMTPEQQAFAHDMERAEVPHRVAQSYDEAIKILQSWGVLDDRIRPQ